MARELKVYGWTGWINAEQARCIMAAHSQKELLSVTGLTRHQFSWRGSETGNPAEIEVAMSEPGVEFRIPLNARYHDTDPKEWFRIEPGTGRYVSRKRASSRVSEPKEKPSMNTYRFVLTMKAPHQGPALGPSIGPDIIEFRSGEVKAKHAASPAILELFSTLEATYTPGGPRLAYLEHLNEFGVWRPC